ncbi:hypothetical protein ACFL14_00385 [Patescibacteria group bacterium]
MSKRSVTSRNFLGGFLGGFLGILAFGYINPPMMIVGCFFGVLLGFWYEEIWQSIRDTFVASVVKLVALTGKIDQSIRSVLPKLGINMEPMVHFFSETSQKIRNSVLCNKTKMREQSNLICALIKRTEWDKAIIILAIILLAGQYFLVPFWTFGLKFLKAEGPVILFNSLIMMGYLILFCFIGSFSVAIVLNQKPNENNFFVGVARLIARLLVAYSKILLILFALALIWIGVWMTSFALVLVLLIFPLTILYGIYSVVTRLGHWLCLGVTLTITYWSSKLVGPYFSDVHILWMVALGTGISSGLVAEGLRRLITKLFEMNKGLHDLFVKKDLSSPIIRLSAPIERWASETSNRLFESNLAKI